VADVFTGSTVIAQAAADAGHRVFASDALASAAVFARALLGVDLPATLPAVKKVISDVLSVRSREIESPWLDLLTAEERAVLAGDGQRLIDQARCIPQVWRPRGATRAMQIQFEALAERRSLSAIALGTLATTHYAGTYLGLRQAIDVDEIRCAIEACSAENTISAWERDVLLTGLLSATSSCAFSAGKHFAQPHLLRADKDLGFARVRIVADRRVDVPSLFAERATITWQRGSSLSNGHAAAHSTLEDLVATPDCIPRIDVIYADPPYTAQQYSRFYHVLEVLTAYRVPVLQTVNGTVTRGVYPIGRFKSRFSSRTMAPHAFHDLCALAGQLGAGLTISYSATRNGQTGNERMITLEDLTSICRAAFGSGAVRTLELSHRYRQFNNAANAIDDRDDVEYLIVCRAQ
jgi:adenine-specific DNA methylase